MLGRILAALAKDLYERGDVDVTEADVDSSHTEARRGPLVWETRRGKAAKIMALADRDGLPITAGIPSDERHETKLVIDCDATNVVGTSNPVRLASVLTPIVTRFEHEVQN